MVHQHFMLVENFTVTQNIILGSETVKGHGILDMKRAKEDVKAIVEKYGLQVDPDALISDISVGMQQRVEILKALYRGAEILILDEPTAVLTPQEIEELIHIMKKLIADGKTIIIITHKLKEIKKSADFCTIIRRGEYVDTVKVADVSQEDRAAYGRRYIMNRTLEKILKKPITATLVSIILGFILAAVILATAGYNPAEAFGSLLRGTLGRPKYTANVLIKSTPIILTGLSIAFAYKMGLFNIGAEGQYIMGAIASTIVGILCDFHPLIQIPLIIIAGVAAGALYGGLAGYLKAKFGINEVITTIMLNWIALYLCNFISQLPPFFKSGTTGTYAINQSGYTTFFSNWKTSEEAAEFIKNHPMLGDILRTDFNIGIFVALLLAVGISFFLYRTVKGYELRAVGCNKDAAEFAGISVRKNIIHTMLIAGALSGLAAALNITGTNPHNISHLAMFEQNGMNGIAVAFIAGGSPVGCIFSGLLFGGLLYGGQSIQYEVGAPSEIINIMIGTIVFFVALTKILPSLADRLAKRGGKNA